MTQIARLSELQDNWDSYGARTIRPEIIAAAAEFSRWLEDKVSVAPAVVPLSNGCVEFEWHDDSRTLELEFESAEKIHYLQWNPDAGEEREGVISIQDKLEVLKLLQWYQR